MIKIELEAIGNKVFESREEKGITLIEASLINKKLDEVKSWINSLEFESELEIKEGYDEEDLD